MPAIELCELRPGAGPQRFQGPMDVKVGSNAAQVQMVLADEEGRNRISRHIFTVTVGNNAVTLHHERPATRDHGVSVRFADLGTWEPVHYGAHRALSGKGFILVADSPGQVLDNTYREIRIAFMVHGAIPATSAQALPDTVITERAEPAGPSLAEHMALTPAQRDMVTALALPWICGDPSLYIGPGGIMEMWHLRGKNTVRKTMAQVIDKMRDYGPPLWHTGSDYSLAGGDENAAAILAHHGVVGLRDVENLHLIDWVRGEGPARRYSGVGDERAPLPS